MNANGLGARAAAAVAMVGALWCAGAAPSAAAGANEGAWRVSVSLTWDLGLRVGVEYHLPTGYGISASAGSSLLSLEGDLALTGDLVGVVPLLRADDHTQVDFLAGVNNFILVITRPPSLMWALGVSGRAAVRIAERWDLALRGGLGYPIFSTAEGWSAGGTSFPLGLWPDLALQLGHTLAPP